MATHLNKPSADLVIDLVNATGVQTPLKVGDVTFDVPVVVSNGTRNTSVVMRGVRANGFRGTRTIRYNRLDLSVAMPPTDGQSMEVMVPNDGFETKLEVCDRLNKLYNLKIGADDIVDGPVDTTVLPASTTIQSKAGSLAWFGSMSIEFVPDRPFYKDTFSSFVLEGLPTPEPGNIGLNTPTVVTNVTPSFTDGGNLYYPGNATYPATNFVVSSNSEIEVAVAPRSGSGAVATAPDVTGYTYNLTLAGANDWTLMISIGSKKDPVEDVLDGYRLYVEAVGPDGTVASLEIKRDETSLGFFHSTLPVLRHGSDVQLGLVQASLSIRDISSVLGTIVRNGAGAPMGVYMLRVMARRINTVVPRVVATISVKVTN